jgi:hypothetical protein
VGPGPGAQITSRLSEFPYEYNGAPRFGVPIGARFGEVEIFVEPSNARPEPVLPARPLQIAEDKPTLLTLRSSDADSSQDTIRHYITEFPKHGELHQVLSVTPVLNTTYDTTLNITAENLPAALCTTTFPDCKSGNCDAPHRRCWYADEEFVIGPPVAREEQVLRQRPRAILNATAALVRDDDRFPTKECILTDRTYGFEANSWAGESFCALADQDNVPSRCRRCKDVGAGVAPIPPGSWGGRLMYDLVHLQAIPPPAPLLRSEPVYRRIKKGS